MPNVLDKLKQWSDGDVKMPDNQNPLSKKAYSNMMVYLKELKLHNVKNLELAEQIFLLSENSVEKLNEMHEVLTEKLGSATESKEAEELLHRTEFLQRQVGELAVMLREVYKKQESAAHEEPSDSVSEGITYEEFKEMQDVWQQFEQKMTVKFVNQESQIRNAIQAELQHQQEHVQHQQEQLKNIIGEGITEQKNGIASAIKNEMYGFRTDLAEAVRDEITEYNDNIKDMSETVRGELTEYNDNVKDMAKQSRESFEDSLENHERGIKKEITAVQEMLEDSLREQYNTILTEVSNVKKVVKGYARTAMWASCLALIVLILDILILK